ncbi:MAG: phage protein Gp37 [Smithella sp.]|jgi:hypothetical protein
MLDIIEQAICDRIKFKLADAAGKVDVQRGIEGIPVQAVYVSLEEGAFKRTTLDTFCAEVTGYVDIVFKGLQSEEQRRKGILPILEGIILCLLQQKLGLKIDPIVPKSFRNTTSDEHKKAGLIIFTLQIITKYYITKVDDEKITELITIGLNYYLKPGDDNADASDQLTLREV